MPARADLVLEFIPVSAINSSGSTAAAVTGITMDTTMPGGNVAFIQVALRDTLVGTTIPPLAPGSPRSSIPGNATYPDPRWNGFSPPPMGGSTDQEFGLVQHFTRIQNLLNVGQTMNQANVVVQPPNPDSLMDGQFGNANLRLVGDAALPMSFIAGGSNAPILSDFGGLASAGFMIPNIAYDFFAAPNAALNGRIPLFNMRLEVLNNLVGGTQTMRLSDRSADPDFTVLRNGSNSADLSNYITLDSVIFGGSHPFFDLNINVIAVPEPTSMALVGMALAGIGYRKLRRKKEVVA
jgi:hypothetical protein